MSNKKKLRRDVRVKTWVNADELRAIDASAAMNSLSRAEYLRDVAVGRPLQARNRLCKAERMLQRRKLEAEAKERRQEAEARERAAEDARMAAQAREWERARKRREAAEAAIKQAGSVTARFDSLSAKGREQWRDLLDELLRDEKYREQRRRETERSLRMLEPLPRPNVLSPPPPSLQAQSEWVPASWVAPDPNDWWVKNTGMTHQQYAQKNHKQAAKQPTELLGEDLIRREGDVQRPEINLDDKPFDGLP